MMIIDNRSEISLKHWYKLRDSSSNCNWISRHDKSQCKSGTKKFGIQSEVNSSSYLRRLAKIGTILIKNYHRQVLNFWIRSRNQNETGRKAHQESAHVKIENWNFVITFFDIWGDNSEALGTQSSNWQCCVLYWRVLKRLQWPIAAKRPELCKVNNWLLHHKNTTAHRSVKTMKFVAYHQMTIFEHTANSSDLARMISTCA